MADGVLAISGARTPIGSEDLHHENTILFQEYHDKTWDEVLKLAADTLQRVVTRVESLGEQELARRVRFFPWQGERPLWRLIVGSGCIHSIGHMAEFHKNRGHCEQAGKILGEMARSMVDLDDGAAWQGEVKYNLACHHSLLGVKVEAIRALRESLALNPGLEDLAKQDPDLEALRDEPEYQALCEHRVVGGS
jgi:hypothetical protein